MDIKTINSVKARQSFSDILNETGFGGRRIVVTRKGKAVAAIVPLDDLEAIQAFEDQKDIEAAENIVNDPESEYIPWNEAKKDLRRNS